MSGYSSDYFKKIYNRSGEAEQILKIRANMLLARRANLKRVLDIGCGYGYLLKELKNAGVRAYGVDFSSKALRVAEEAGIKVKRSDVSQDKLPFKKNFFDAVTMFDLVEHLLSPDLVLKEACRVLRPGGILFLTTPNNQGWLREILVRIFPDDPTHVNVQNAKYWREKLSESGFKNIELKGCILHGFPPLPGLRSKLKALGISGYIGPIFSPILSVCGDLYIWGKKTEK